jgi:hypothetical protein
MAKGYWIDSDKRTVTEVEVNGLRDIQRYVGGYIEVAYRLGPDCVYVDEEGLLKSPNQFFTIGPNGKFHQAHQFFAGNGLYLGAEVENDDGETDNDDPTVTLDELKKAILFTGAGL